MKRLLATILLVFLAGAPLAAQNANLTDAEYQAKIVEFRRSWKKWTIEERVEEIESLTALYYRFPSERRSDFVEFMLRILAGEKEDDDQVIPALAKAIARARSIGDLEMLQDWFRKLKRPHQRIAVLYAIGEMRFPQAKEYMESLWKSRDPVVRTGILRSNQNSDAAVAVARAIASLQDRKAEVRSAAASTLVNHPVYDSVEPLIDALEKEEEEHLRDEYAAVLESVTEQTFGTDVERWRDWWDVTKDADVAPVRISNAIDSGAAWLREEQGWDEISENERELVAYTLAHANVPHDDELMVKLIDHLVTMEFKRTYNVSIAAMALQAIDAEKYQGRIAEIAYWLIANQNDEGAWGYGNPEVKVPWEETTAPKPSGKSVTLSGDDDEAAETITVYPMKIPRPKRAPANTSWDHSNTQYALLGLRACADAGVVIFQDVWRDAEKHWRDEQFKDGGWAYGKNEHGEAYGSMTTAGVAGLVIAMYYQGKPYERDRALKMGQKWLGENFSVMTNPKKEMSWHYYYLYGLERAGMLAGAEEFGEHRWYLEGARYLLLNQHDDGYWGSTSRQDTCFAILFLRRATRRLVPNPITESRR